MSSRCDGSGKPVCSFYLLPSWRDALIAKAVIECNRELGKKYELVKSSIVSILGRGDLMVTELFMVTSNKIE